MLIVSACDTEQTASSKAVADACLRIRRTAEAFGRYPGPDTGAVGGDDALAVFRWKRDISGEVAGASDGNTGQYGYRGLYTWAYGSGANETTDTEFLGEVRQYYVRASEETLRPLRELVRPPEPSSLLRERCNL